MDAVWTSKKIALKYGGTEILSSGGLYKQIEY